MKLGYRPEEAAGVLGSAQLLTECVEAGWIAPRVRRHKMTIYDYADLARCWKRICDGEQPLPAPPKHPRKP